MSHLPSGTVTFLFTDIESSTHKWQNWPHKMKAALKRHDEILQKAIDDSGGWVFKTVGDAFCAAFHTAMDCILCVIDIQMAINTEQWNLPEQIKVRMSIHTGEAIERNHDYYGPALNRVARLEALACGGQVLLSLVTAELIRDMLPEPAGLKFMGNHRLKDLTRPEGVYQLMHPSIPKDFPPVKSLDSHPHNLSVQPGLLIGREKELALIQEKLLSTESRVVTITGTGGMGKTRISLQAAAEIIERFKNGVFFIDLTLISNESFFYSLILSTLSIKESGGKSEFELLKGYLRDKNILLILDNFEHIMNAAVLVPKLLSECHGVKVLVTTREALHIRGEKIYRLPPLLVPVFDRKKVPSVKKLTQYDSVRLFIERAVEVDESFKIDNKNAPSVAEICVRVDGIPLAIELAAARITALSPLALLKRLSHRLEILTFGAADLPDRQQTLRTTIDWSFDLLNKDMQNLFMSLSVFAGGFDIEAAEVVCQTLPGSSALDGIEHLLEKSLLIKNDLAGGEPWFSMLETIHEYASEQLKNNDLQTLVQEKYAEYFFVLAEKGETGIKSHEQKFWMEKLSHNHENLIAVLNSFEMNGGVEKLATMAGSLGYFWQYKGLFLEGISWYRRILILNIENKNLEKVIRLGLGRLLGESGQYEESRDILSDLLNLSIPGSGIYIKVSYELAWTLYKLNDLEGALKYFHIVLKVSSESEYMSLRAKSKSGLGSIYWRMNRLDDAEKSFLFALTCLSNFSDPRSIAQVANNLGIINYENGNIKAAIKFFDQALSSYKVLGEINSIRDVLNNLGYLYCRTEEYNLSKKYYKELIQLTNISGDNFYYSTACSGLASALLGGNEIKTALIWAEQAKDLVSTQSESVELGISLRVLGDIFSKKKNREKAMEFFRKSISIFKNANEKEELELAINGLALIENK